MKLAEAVRNESNVDLTWKRWVDLITLGVEESRRTAWADCVHVRERREPGSPLLHLASLRVDSGHASMLVRLVAGELGIVAVQDVEPLSLILAGVERDAETFDVLASRLAIPADMVAVLTQLCALPLLLNVAKQLSPDASRTWQRGYCPVCGAWPAMVEMRGIQRERRMRCGCCGSDWVLPVLRCAFCDETDHTKLGVLLTEQGEQHVRVETCSTCRGYLKALTTLSALPFPTLAWKDMSTVAFDLVARDRGYLRPARSGWPLRVEIVQ